jgi:tRNA pseudouridine13 synthase
MCFTDSLRALRRGAFGYDAAVSTTLAYLTPHFPGIGGVIKQRPEDFFVQELPAYEPSGSGEHVYAEVQKIGLTTFDAINRLAGALGISSRDIGYAGLKDARAIARQIFSIPGTTEQKVMSLQLPGISVQ